VVLAPEGRKRAGQRAHSAVRRHRRPYGHALLGRGVPSRKPEPSISPVLRRSAERVSISAECAISD
jgi:hypothetical protein